MKMDNHQICFFVPFLFCNLHNDSRGNSFLFFFWGPATGEAAWCAGHPSLSLPNILPRNSPRGWLTRMTFQNICTLSYWASRNYEIPRSRSLSTPLATLTWRWPNPTCLPHFRPCLRIVGPTLSLFSQTTLWFLLSHDSLRISLRQLRPPLHPPWAPPLKTPAFFLPPYIKPPNPSPQSHYTYLTHKQTPHFSSSPSFFTLSSPFISTQHNT